MKRNRLACIFAIIMSIFLVVSIAEEPVLAASIKAPSQVKKLNVKSLSSTSVSLSWGKVSKANGYQVYQKAGNGAWKKIATIKSGKKTKYVSKKLKASNVYRFKVRAYKKYKSNGKTKYKYGKFSSVKKFSWERKYNVRLCKNELADIRLTSIGPDGAILSVKNLLNNRSIYVYPNAIAFDGQIVDLRNDYQNEIAPGKTMKIVMEGTVKSYDHRLVSLNGQIEAVNSSAWAPIDAVNVDIGGTKHLEKAVPKGKVVYDSETTLVKYVKLTDEGPVFWVENKKDSSSDIMVDTIKVNGKEFDYKYVFRYPGKSADYYSVDFAYYVPDIVASTMKSWNVGMGIMNDDEQFPIDSSDVK